MLSTLILSVKHARRQKYGTKRRYAREKGDFLPIGNRQKKKKERRADARRSQQREGGRQKGEGIARWRGEDCEKVARGLREDCERTERGL